MGTIIRIAQRVNGDPYADGSNINIVNNSNAALTFLETDGTLGIPAAGEMVSFDGGATWLNYEYIGSGDVRGDPAQSAAFIRITLPDGSTETYAIDLNGGADLSQGNTKLTAADLDPTTTPAYPPCFVAGTLIETATGPRPVEQIEPGDMVQTLDNGPRPVRWAGSRRVAGIGPFAPIRFARGVLGNDRALFLSPQHRVLVRGWRAELYLGEPELLVAATHLVDGAGITRAPRPEVCYHHVMFDQHEIVLAEGAATESFHPGADMLEADAALRAELVALFPSLSCPETAGGWRTARRVLRGYEAQMLRGDIGLAA